MDFTEATTTDAKRLVRSDFWKATAVQKLDARLKSMKTK